MFRLNRSRDNVTWQTIYKSCIQSLHLYAVLFLARPAWTTISSTLTTPSHFTLTTPAVKVLIILLFVFCHPWQTESSAARDSLITVYLFNRCNTGRFSENNILLLVFHPVRSHRVVYFTWPHSTGRYPPTHKHFFFFLVSTLHHSYEFAERTESTP